MSRSPDSAETARPRTTSADVGRRGVAMAVAAAGAGVYVGLAVAIYAVLEEKTQGAAIVFFVLALGALGGAFMPLVSLVHRIWRSGNAGLRHENEQRIAHERVTFETAREYERRRREQQAALRRSRDPRSG